MILLRDFPLPPSRGGARRDLEDSDSIEIQVRRSGRMACQIGGNFFRASRSLTSEPDQEGRAFNRVDDT
jgi:hypothetical protein